MSRSLFCLGAMIASVCAADWKDDVAFRAKFDGSLDASVGSADRKLYNAPSYQELAGARAGLDGTDVSLAKGAGRSGDALRFAKKNEKAVFYRAQGNIPFDPKNWSGTLSFWLRMTVAAPENRWINTGSGDWDDPNNWAGSEHSTVGGLAHWSPWSDLPSKDSRRAVTS